ncbi:MAG: polysaccharide biosynthesis/export family protein [Bacteroidales bacterium]|nr:polysaccharide biosynthesis/export family protein [Bacteroidales bacterium]
MKIKVRSIFKLIMGLFLAASVLLSSSCVSQRKVKLLQEKSKQPTTQFENTKTSTYKVKVGDHLYIRVYSVDPKTSKFFQTDFPYLMNSTYQYLNTYLVDEFGFINFSFIDKLYVKGLSVLEVKDLIQKTLDEYFKETTVYIKLVNFQVAVLGEVNSPGNFTIEQDQINIFQALGLAGGVTDYGNYKKVKIVRQSQTGSIIEIVDLTETKILESPYYYLMPNDMVYIEPRNAKSWAPSQFQYGTLVAFISTILLGYTIFAP